MNVLAPISLCYTSYINNEKLYNLFGGSTIIKLLKLASTTVINFKTRALTSPFQHHNLLQNLRLARLIFLTLPQFLQLLAQRRHL